MGVDKNCSGSMAGWEKSTIWSFFFHYNILTPRCLYAFTAENYSLMMFRSVLICFNILRVDDFPMKHVFVLARISQWSKWLPWQVPEASAMRKLLKGLAKNEAEVIFGILQLCAWCEKRCAQTTSFSSSPIVQKHPGCCPEEWDFTISPFHQQGM